jgi:hypothetical protein
MKKVAKNEDEKMVRYLGALNEMHGETLKGIKEGFVVVNRKIDTINDTLDSHTEMIGTLMEDVSILKTDVSTLKSDMIIVKEDLSVIKSDLKKKVDYDEFLSLVKRVQKIEAKI